MINLIKTIVAILVLLSGFLIKSNLKIAYEITTGGILFAALCFIFCKIFYKDDFLIRKIISIDNLLLFAIACVYTTQGLVNITDTDIPRLKFIIRGIYYFFIVFMIYMGHKYPGSIKTLIATIFIFASFPFSWLYVIGDIKSIPLTIAALAFLIDKKVFSNIKLNGFEVIVLSIPVLLLTGFFNHDYYNTTANLSRFFLGIIVFLLAKKEITWSKKNLYFILIFHLLFFLYGLVNNIIDKKDILSILEKKSFISGINTNDISAYILFFIAPLVIQYKAQAKAWKKKQILIILSILVISILILQAKTTLSILLIFFLVFFLLGKFSKQSTLVILSLIIFVNILVFTFFTDLKSNKILDTFHDRRFLWEQATEAIKKKPVFGWGGDNWMVLSSVRSSGSENRFAKHREYFTQNALVHSHNTVLQLWTDNGILLVLVFTGFWVFALSGIFKQKNLKQLALNSGLISLILYFGNSVFNYTLFHFPILFAFFVILALSEYLNTKRSMILSDSWFSIFSLVTIVFFSSQLLSLYFFNKAKSDLNYKINPLGYVELNNRNPNSMDKLSHAHLALQLTKDTRADQLYAELNLQKYLKTKHLDFFNKAEKSYLHCANHSANPGFCFRRLEKLYALTGQKDKAFEAHKKAIANDPFEIFF